MNALKITAIDKGDYRHFDTSRAKLLNAASHQQVEHMEDIAQNFTLTNGHNQERHCNNHKVNSYSIHM